MQQAAKRILMVEDHPLVADATRSLLLQLDLNLEIHIRGTMEDAVQTFREADDWYRILLDIGVPNAHGLSLVRTFHRFGVAERCAVVTASDNAQWRAEVQAMGMLGYIVKAAQLDDFSLSIRNVLHGRRVFSMADGQAPAACCLTRRQQDILCLLHRGLSSKEIAAQLGLTIGTVNNHVTGLLRVLKVNNRTHALSRAMDLGYLHAHGIA